MYCYRLATTHYVITRFVFTILMTTLHVDIVLLMSISITHIFIDTFEKEV